MGRRWRELGIGLQGSRMSDFFNRKCRVTVGPETGGTGTSVDDSWRIAFKVNQNEDGKSNAVDVSIYNLTDSTHAKLAKEDQVLQLEAGYENNMSVIAVADITRVIRDRELPNIITRIECHDGFKTLSDIKLSLSFDAGSTVGQVVRSIANNLAIDYEPNSQVDLTKVYLNGFSYTGRCGQALDKVANFLGVDWVIQNRVLYFVNKNQALQGRAVLLSPASGLIGSPKNIIEENKKNGTKRKGYEVQSKLNPKIRPNQPLILKSRDVDGTFKIGNVTIESDTRGAEWKTTAHLWEYNNG